jgi:hypothetical protein
MNILETPYYKLEFDGLRDNPATDTALAYYLACLGREDQYYANWWGETLLATQITPEDRGMLALAKRRNKR